LKTVKRMLRKMIYTVPGTQALWVGLNRAVGREGRSAFSGWGMATFATPPWHAGQGDELASDFSIVNSDVIASVRRGQFRLSQFDEVQDKTKKLHELMWRHYVVFWSARYASRATASPVNNLVECGVCDGLTAYFAMNAVKGDGPFKAFLYDAWEGMKAEYLLETEHGAVGNYSYLSLENTRRNLAAFEGASVFVKGLIPESFDTAGTPSEVVWLHIDLNASLPTTAALNALFDKILPGGVILFDDYAWPGFHDTKVAVDRFFDGKRGVLLPMPTGQAMFFKH
jgi:methyltransferase family protein